MNEPSKVPFEPIPMPELPAMPAIPDMPSMPEMPRPSFSRSSNPSTPILRKPLMIAEDHFDAQDTRDKPNPFLLPPGIAPEAPPSQLPPAPAAPASSGFPLSWLKPTRAKGVVFAGLASLGIGAFGLNALFPKIVHEPKADDLTITKPMANKPAPKVIEERPTAVEPPALLAPEVIASAEPIDPWNKKTPIVTVEGTTPAPLTVPTIPATPAPTGPLPVPLAVPSGPLPAPAVIPVVPEVPMAELPPVKIDSLPPVKIDTLSPVDTTPKLTPTPLPPVVVTPIEAPKVVPVEPLPMPILTPEPKLTPTPVPVVPITPEPKLTPTPVPVVPITPEIKPEPNPLPIPGPLPLPFEKPPATVPASVDAKTDYDVDIHKLKSGDTYAAISEKFYGTANYAGAIRVYNDGVELARLRDVQVPPIHVIKKFGAGAAPTDTPRVLPVGVLQDPGLVAPPPIERDIQWGTPGSRKTDKPADGGVNWR